MSDLAILFWASAATLLTERGPFPLTSIESLHMSLSRWLTSAKRALPFSALSAFPLELVDERPAALTGPNREYRRFILLGHQRSGSSLVIRSLRKHPQVVSFGELFVHGRIGFNVDGFDNASEALQRAREADPVGFLDHYVYAGYPDSVRAVGFKLFPEQIDTPHFDGVWDWIQQNRDVRIIYLNRTNRLASLTSLAVAKDTGVYGITDASQRPSVTVRLEREACEEEFERRDRYDALCRERIAGHPVMDLTYEEVSRDPVAAIRDIQEFLGVDQIDPQLDMVKKEVRPLSQVIDNFDELKREFAQTKWSSYFDA